MNKLRAHIRCAIYTRKSSDEGLEQDFNSLDAQREACEAYITSQRHEGWLCLSDHYDDGGISGATLVRPALLRLLEDVRGQKVDVVVVYKVDRLTRALADFAKIVEIFDASSASFVSVTQQFNTTSSMGRLTLNVLLSFAQFEREVTAERIRDKIAASKRKGMWMGGTVPLGYDAKDRTLKINSGEVETVRSLFRMFIEYQSVRRVTDEANRLGLHTKLRPQLDGKMKGGRPFTRGHMYRILSNPIYIGQISHKGQLSQGLHPPIIDEEIWGTVQTCFSQHRTQRRTRNNAQEPSLLAGKLFSHRGNPFTPSHAVKRGKRYRYYVERLVKNEVGQLLQLSSMRIPAAAIEGLVFDSIARILGEPSDLVEDLGLDRVSFVASQTFRNAAASFARKLSNPSSRQARALGFAVISKVEIGLRNLSIDIDVEALCRAMSISDLVTDCARDSYTFVIAVELRRRGKEMKLVIADSSYRQTHSPDSTLIKAVVQAHVWAGTIGSGGRALQEIAHSEKVTDAYIRRNLKLAFLAPDIIEAILDGRQAADITLEKMTRTEKFPLDWNEQRRLFRLMP